MSASTIRLWIFGLAVLAVLLGAGLLWRYAPPSSGFVTGPAGQSGTASIGGPFALTDHRGNRVTEARLAGHLTLIYFGYATCPDVCPVELQTIGAALDLLAAGKPERLKDIQGFFITIDPERDTVAALADYMPNFHPKLTGLTGSPGEIAAAAKAWRVYYKKAEAEPGSESYLMDHSNIIYLMGRDGKFLAHFGTGAQAGEIAGKLREFLK